MRLGADATFTPAALFTERGASAERAAAFHCRSGADQPGPGYKQRNQTSCGANTGEFHHAADHYGFRPAAEAQPPAAAEPTGCSARAAFLIRHWRSECGRRTDGGAVDGE